MRAVASPGAPRDLTDTILCVVQYAALAGFVAGVIGFLFLITT